MDLKNGSTVPLHTYRRDSMENPPHYTPDNTYTDVYKPMLSECIEDTMTNSDLKLHDQWIVRRKRIIYFLTIATVFAVILCAISLIYVLPNVYGEEETKTVKDPFISIEEPFPEELEKVPQLAVGNIEPEVNHTVLEDLFIVVDDVVPSIDNSGGTSGVGQIPTLQGEDYSKFNVGDGNSGESGDFYIYCIISAIPRYQKYSKNCNSVVFREVEGMDPTLYFSDKDFDLNAIINVRITSALSEALVQKVLGVFPNIQKLTVCIDQLCFGQMERDVDNLPVVSLPNVVTLEIVNSTLCGLGGWIFNKWNLPSIEKLTISQAKFPRKVYQSLENFSERHYKTLISIDIKSCQCGRQICQPSLTHPTTHHTRHHKKSTHPGVAQTTPTVQMDSTAEI